MVAFKIIFGLTCCLSTLLNISHAYHEDIYDYQYDEPTDPVPTIGDLVESNSLNFAVIEDLVTLAADWPMLVELSPDRASLKKYNFLQTLEENGYSYEVNPLTGSNNIHENAVTITDDMIAKIKSLKTKMVPKHGLSESCNNQLCDMMKYLFVSIPSFSHYFFAFPF